ncbi:hypothetical protein [Vulcanisaeta thermophila]|uniref:hypothetical protein n=1 Tax=Vulcanisaeta thermophila TaxID=867917 RepID=UPI000853BC86|nr:hypothetical protein [Vulcanisaeta thermophila]
MRSSISNGLIEALSKVVGNDWVRIDYVERVVGVQFPLNLLYELNKTRLFEVMYDVLEDSFYIKRRVMSDDNEQGVGSAKINMQRIVERLRSEVRGAVPKPEFEDLLMKLVGEAYQLVYNQLLNDGVIEEEIISGMVFVKVK